MNVVQTTMVVHPPHLLVVEVDLTVEAVQSPQTLVLSIHVRREKELEEEEEETIKQCGPKEALINGLFLHMIPKLFPLSFSIFANTIPTNDKNIGESELLRLLYLNQCLIKEGFLMLVVAAVVHDLPPYFNSLLRYPILFFANIYFSEVYECLHGIIAFDYCLF